MIYAVGHISGAHLNPAVTIGFFSAGRLPAFEVPRYWLAQLLGASLAALAVRFIFYHQATDIGVTLPSGLWWQSFLLEFVLTAILMFVIMGVTTDYRAQGLMAGVAIGATIAFEAILGGPISGASMNPARSFGPALITGIFRHHWIYWIAPLAGSMAGARLYLLTRCDPSADAGSQGCC
jgi:MIP family channel proteins